ncbi:MAG TPA: hypothetical protein VF792_03995 [Ktedonobacterales bacterium]
MEAITVNGAGHPTREPASGPTPSSRLSGGWLLVARVIWVTLLAVFVIPPPLGIPAYITRVEHPPKNSTLLPPGVVKALAGAGVSLQLYAYVLLAILFIVVTVSVTFAFVLFWRRNDDWMALVVSLFIATYPIIVGDPTTSLGGFAARTSHSPFDALFQIVENVIFFALLFGVAVLFPTGRFVPRWSWLLLVATCLWVTALAVDPMLGGGILVLGYPLMIISAIACMVYRYRRVSTPTQRTQTRWIIAGFAVTLIGNQVYWLPPSFTPLGQTLYPPIVYLIYLLSLILIPITFFIAVQRYRLYDIDRIINRALVYGSLTAILVGLYVGCVIGAQEIIRATSHDANAQTPIVTVATTLLIAALIRPLRARIQRFIDARFYRQRYDAARLLARFGVTLRSEVDLPALSDHLVETVDEAMQPAHISLLLLPTSRETNHQPDTRIARPTKSPQAGI